MLLISTQINKLNKEADSTLIGKMKQKTSTDIRRKGCKPGKYERVRITSTYTKQIQNCSIQEIKERDEQPCPTF